MNPKQKKRFYGIIVIFILVSMASGLILFSLKQNINLFYTPTQLAQTKINFDKTLKIGGYVKTNSIRYDNSGESIHFIVTDRSHEIAVNYRGILPNLFREGQTVVVTGKLNSLGMVMASQVLAKHDEKYFPKPFEKELKKGAKYDT